VHHIYDAANNLIAEASGPNVADITRYYIHGAGLNQMVQSNQSYTYHFSAQGHTLGISDNQGEIKNQYAYSSFGRILGQTEEQGLEQPFKYVGQFGVQHESVRARYYDAELGRFLKEDPIGFAGGLNVSLYVGGNPVVGIDPSGLTLIIIGTHEQVDELQTAIGTLQNSNPTTANQVNQLINSNHTHVIQYPIGNYSNGTTKTSFNDNLTNGVGTGSTVTVDPTVPLVEDGVVYSGTSVLAHELLGHGLDANNGAVNLDNYSAAENSAISTANIFRESVGELLRPCSN